MALTRNKPLVVVLLLGFVIMSTLTIGAQSIGVCYGTNGNNLPSASQVINLYKSNGIGSMRIYDPNSDTLQALKGSGIELILDVPNTSLQSLASDASAASTWVQNNVVNYASDVKFRYIAVGNEVLPTGSNAHSDASSFINPIISFLAENGSPLLANIYPYFSYTGDTQNIRLDYALFTASGVVVQDGSYQYQNLFDAFLSMASQMAILSRAPQPSPAISHSTSSQPRLREPALQRELAEPHPPGSVHHSSRISTPKKIVPVYNIVIVQSSTVHELGNYTTHRCFKHPDTDLSNSKKIKINK
ncbi:unnamed protein product, partial [Vitis vinifera]